MRKTRPAFICRSIHPRGMIVARSGLAVAFSMSAAPVGSFADIQLPDAQQQGDRLLAARHEFHVGRGKLKLKPLQESGFAAPRNADQDISWVAGGVAPVPISKLLREFRGCSFSPPCRRICAGIRELERRARIRFKARSPRRRNITRSEARHHEQSAEVNCQIRGHADRTRLDPEEPLKQVIAVAQLEPFVGERRPGSPEKLKLLADLVQPIDDSPRQLERGCEPELLPFCHHRSDQQQDLNYRMD